MITVYPKLPGFSAALVLGLSIGALLNKDFANATITFLVAASDCLRIESSKRATQAAKEDAHG
ncbi:hypothetical protein [Comamonas jiangduensis]|uniref:hypothetical protein n=1 Tax=Comamonas jiangduensis TaxID=1194168 RepID=UPI0024E11813|nr:hypothetical protein [Comamonas jiangduensis]